MIAAPNGKLAGALRSIRVDQSVMGTPARADGISSHCHKADAGK